jgi:hypothetical protein
MDDLKNKYFSQFLKLKVQDQGASMLGTWQGSSFREYRTDPYILIWKKWGKRALSSFLYGQSQGLHSDDIINSQRPYLQKTSAFPWHWGFGFNIWVLKVHKNSEDQPRIPYLAETFFKNKGEARHLESQHLKEWSRKITSSNNLGYTKQGRLKLHSERSFKKINQ